MSTVIYLANKDVQVVDGTVSKNSVQIRKYHTATAPEGSIINGMVMDTESFVPFLKELWTSQGLPTKDVTLVIDSTKFVGKIFEVPQVPEKKVYEIVEREYIDMGRDSEMVNSFIKLGPGEGKNTRIYAEATDPDFVGDYVDLFNQVGIKLSAIYSGESALITFTSRELSKKHKTFVLMIADIMTFTMVLWVNGSFSYYNSTRCFQVPGTPMYADDLARAISTLNQFMQANNMEHQLECIEIAGIHPDDRDMYAEAIRNVGMNTPVEVFNLSSAGRTDLSLQHYLHAVSGLYDGGKTENVLPRYQLKRKKQKKGGIPGLKYIIGIAVLAFVLLIITIAMALTMMSKKAQLKELEDYNTSPTVMFGTAEFDTVSERNNFLERQNNAIANVEANLITYPLGNTDVVKVFDKCALGYAEVSYESFDAVNGTIRIDAKADNVDDINKFIKKLMEEAIFSEVNYTGYEWSDNEAKWNISVTCTLAESAGRKLPEKEEDKEKQEEKSETEQQVEEQK